MTAPSPTPQEPFTPPPAEPVSQSFARRNLLIAGVLAGGGCLLVLLLVIVLIVVFAVRGGGVFAGAGPEGVDVTALSPEEQAAAPLTDYFTELPVEAYAEALEIADVYALHLLPGGYELTIEQEFSTPSTTDPELHVTWD